MKCTNCGATLENDAKICVYCGSEELEQKTVSNSTSDKKSKNKKFIILGAIVGVIVIALIVLLCVLRTPERTTEKFFDGFFDEEADELISLFPPKMIKEGMKEEDMTREDLIDSMEEEIEYYTEELDDEFDRWRYVGVTDIETDDYSKEEVKEFNQDIKDVLGFDLKANAITHVYTDIKIRGDGDNEYVEAELLLVKVGLQWYVWDWFFEL